MIKTKCSDCGIEIEVPSELEGKAAYCDECEALAWFKRIIKHAFGWLFACATLVSAVVALTILLFLIIDSVSYGKSVLDEIAISTRHCATALAFLVFVVISKITWSWARKCGF